MRCICRIRRMRNSDQPTIHRFGNGLTVLVREEDAHPVASFQFWVQTGSCHEGGRLGSGLSHLLEHMVFKGTEKFSGQELAQKVQRLGGLWNAYTSTNRTVYYIDGPAASWREFLEVLTDLVFHPSFPEDEFDKEKEVIRREMAMYDDDPDAAAYKLLMETLYRKHPRRYPVLGEMDSFNLVTRGDMADYHRGRYCPNNVFVVVAGDVDSKAIIECLGRLTEDLEPGTLLLPGLPREPRQWGTRVARKEFPLPYSKLTLAWRVPEQSHPDSPALSMLARIFGSGRSARLYRKLHDELGLVHDVSATVQQSSGEQGVFLVSADVDRERRDEARQAIFDEITRLAGEDLSGDLARSVKRAKASRIKGMATVSGLADDLAGQWFHFRNPAYFSEWIQAIDAVTVGDIRRVINSWLVTDCITEVSLDPSGSNSADDLDSSSEGKTGLETLTLPNGLQVVLRKDDRLPIVYGCLSFKGGSPFEDASSAGITSLLSECLLKGTASRSADDIAEALENLGGAIDASSGNNSMNITFNVLSEDIERGIELLADVALRPTLPEAAFELERQSMISDVEEQLEDPLATAFNNLKKQSYGDVSYGLPVSGTVASLEAITHARLKEHYGHLVCGANAVFCLAGSFDPEQVKKLAGDYLGGIPSGRPPLAASTPPQANGEYVALMDKEQAVLVLNLPGVDVRSDKRVHASLLHAWCSDMAGPVFVGIREESGLAYYASSSLFMGLDAGNISFYLGTSPEQLDEARAKLEQILDNIYRDGMTAGELERTRSSALSAQMLSRQSNSTLSQRLSLDVLFGLPADNFERQEYLMSRITLPEMNDFIREYLSPECPRVWSVVKNKE